MANEIFIVKRGKGTADLTVADVERISNNQQLSKIGNTLFLSDSEVAVDLSAGSNGGLIDGINDISANPFVLQRNGTAPAPMISISGGDPFLDSDSIINIGAGGAGPTLELDQGAGTIRLDYNAGNGVGFFMEDGPYRIEAFADYINNDTANSILDSAPGTALVHKNWVQANFGTPNLDQVLTVGNLTDNNLIMQSNTEQELVFQRLGVVGDQTNPVFALGRIINGGINEAKLRFIARDDSKYTTERAFFEMEGGGTVASLRDVEGSHYEGFIGTEQEPMFRISSTQPSVGNFSSRIELGSGGTNPTDVFIERQGPNQLGFVLSGGVKQIIFPDSVFKPGGIVDAFQETTITPSNPSSDVLKVYNNNGELGQLDSTGTFTSFVGGSIEPVYGIARSVAVDYVGSDLETTLNALNLPYYVILNPDGDSVLVLDNNNIPGGVNLLGLNPNVTGLLSILNDTDANLYDTIVGYDGDNSTVRYSLYYLDGFFNPEIDLTPGNDYKFNFYLGVGDSNNPGITVVGPTLTNLNVINNDEGQVFVLQDMQNNVNINLGGLSPEDGVPLTQYFVINNEIARDYTFQGPITLGGAALKNPETGADVGSYTFNGLLGAGTIEVRYLLNGALDYDIILSKTGFSDGGFLSNGSGTIANGNSVDLGGSITSATNIALGANPISIQGSGGGNNSPRLSLNQTSSSLGFTPNVGNDRNITIGSGGFFFLETGNAPNIGDVWTASNVNGQGYWAAPGAGSTPNLDTVLGQGGQTTTDRIIELGSLNDITFRSRPTGAIPGRVFFSHWRQDGGRNDRHEVTFGNNGHILSSTDLVNFDAGQLSISDTGVGIQYNKTNDADNRASVNVNSTGIVLSDDSIPLISPREGMILAIDEDATVTSNKPVKYRNTLIYKEIEFDNVDLTTTPVELLPNSSLGENAIYEVETLVVTHILSTGYNINPTFTLTQGSETLINSVNTLNFTQTTKGMQRHKIGNYDIVSLGFPTSFANTQVNFNFNQAATGGAGKIKVGIWFRKIYLNDVPLD